PAADRRAAALGSQRQLGLRPVGRARADSGRHRNPAADGPPLSASLLREAPGRRGERRHAPGHLRGLGVARSAIDDALLDALDDAGKPEQIVGEIPVELVRDANAWGL